MPRRYAKDPQVDKALRHSVRDGVAYSVMAGAGETYFSAFALFFKATTAQIGLLASLPPLVSSLSQLISAWLARKTPTRRQVILAGATLQAFIWLPLILLPQLMPTLAVPLIIGCIIIYHAAGSIVIPQWSSLMGDLVPERRRGRYFAHRTRYTSISAFLALIAAGIVLHYFQQQQFAVYGFVAIFSVAALARCISLYHLTYLVDVHHETVDEFPRLYVVLARDWWRQLRRSRFFHFSTFFAFMQTAVAIGSPFIAVYMLRDLQFSYVEFMLLNAATVLMQFLTLNAWGRISDAFGNRLILQVTGFGIPFIPALWLVSHNFWYLLAVQLCSGLMWAGFNLSAVNFLYDLIPAPKRATYLAAHNIITNIGIFGGALLGGFLGSIIPKSFTLAGASYTLHSSLLGVLLVSFIVRLIVAGLFLPGIKEVRSVRPMTVTELVFRATRFNALSGLIYDIIAAARRGIAKPRAESDHKRRMP